MIQKSAQLLKLAGKLTHKWLGFIPAASILSILAVVAVNLIVSAPVHQATTPDYGSFDNDLLDSTSLNLKNGAFMNDSSPLGQFSGAESTADLAGFAFVDKSSFVNTDVPSSSARPSASGGLLIYKVVNGDNPWKLAPKFGISVNTILLANNLKKTSFLKVGQELVILPVDGVLHEVRPGETIESIAELYSIPSADMKAFNKIKIVEGDMVVVPHGQPLKQSYAPSLPNYNDYFSFPVADGFTNLGKLHLNAVDIVAVCGTAITASADGLVEAVGDPKDLNEPLGGYIKIKHAFGDEVATLYAKTSKNLVSAGDMVASGDKIAEMGNTGRAEGTLGCHLHFGVIGAKNPFAK